MNNEAPFQPSDLAELDAKILSQADAVVALREVYAGNRSPGVIQMRHDVDNASGAFDCAVRLAEWEANRGYRSTYFLLHTARYWPEVDFFPRVKYIAQLGHEIGLHLDAVGYCYVNGGDPHDLLAQRLDEIRTCAQVPVRGCVGHGNRELPPHLTNDAQLLEMDAERGTADRFAQQFGVEPRPLVSFGLDYEAILLGRDYQLTDSGGRWADPGIAKLARRFERRDGQMHFNMHPDWWIQAL